MIRSVWALLVDSQLRLLACITAVIFVVMAALRPDQFVSVTNLRSMSFQFPEFALLSLAVAVTMLTGGIDLSIVSIGLFSATLGVLVFDSALFQRVGDASPASMALGVCFAVTLVSGAAAGFFNGILVTRFALSPILATLGTMQLFSGLTIVLTGGTAIYGFPDGYVFLGNGDFLGVPMPLFLFVVAAGLLWYLLSRTLFGFQIFLLGNNPRAARFSGIPNERILRGAYLLSGLLSAVAGLLMAARTNSINADYGSSYLLLAILVAVLAGVKPEGGFGRVSGLVLAVLSLQFLSSGLNMLRFSSFSKELFWGALLLVVMASNQIFESKRGIGRRKSAVD